MLATCRSSNARCLDSKLIDGRYGGGTCGESVGRIGNNGVSILPKTSRSFCPPLKTSGAAKVADNHQEVVSES